MLKKVRSRLKNQKGFTLIELLAVIVILGILAAIAIPSIMGIINNSKKDAVAADAQQMVSSAKNAAASNDSLITWNADGSAGTATLAKLISQGYMDEPKNPLDSNANFDETNSIVYIAKSGNTLTYTVSLKQTGASGKYYFGSATAGTSSDQLDRNNEQ